MDVAGYGISELAHTRASQRLARQERRLGPDLVQIFYDGERLSDDMSPVQQCRDQALRIERLVVGAVLFAAAAQEMDRDLFGRDTLQVQRYPHAESSGGAEIAIEREFRIERGRRHGRWLQKWTLHARP